MADADLAMKTEMSLSEQRALMDTDLPMLFDNLDKIYRVCAVPTQKFIFPLSERLMQTVHIVT